ncbi:hypothetical protein PFISCL1PPCAC_11700, partial [Pristionchus fissidentatus]
PPTLNHEGKEKKEDDNDQMRKRLARKLDIVLEDVNGTKKDDKAAVRDCASLIEAPELQPTQLQQLQQP